MLQLFGSGTVEQLLVGSELGIDSIWNTISDELAEYVEGGWDGDDAAPVAITAKLGVQTFTTRLPVGTLLPEVSAGYDGSIGLAWSQPEMSMFAHFPPTGEMDFTFHLRRHGFRYSKRLDANARELLEEIKPVLEYIRPQRDAVIFFIGITAGTYTVTSEVKVKRNEAIALDGTPPKPMLNAGRD